MPFTFYQVAAAGDAFPQDRHILYFPTLPSGAGGNTLTLRHTTVNMPPWEVGQIIVKTMGWSLAFAGRRNNPNAFQCSFLETTDAPVIKTLYAWQAIAAGTQQAGGQLKAQYAVNCKLVAADTTGKYGLTCKMYNVWPQNITPGGFDESSGAWHHEVTFSVDAVDIEEVNTHESALKAMRNPNYDYNLYGDSSSFALNNLGISSGLYATPNTTRAALTAALIYSAFF